MYFLKRQLNRARRGASPNRDFERALRARLLSAYSAQYGSAPIIQRWTIPRFVTVGVTSLALIFGTGTGVYAYNSPSVVEGNALYFVKQGIEGVEEQFAFSAEARAQFHLKMSRRRLDEAERHADKEPFVNLLQEASTELGLSTQELNDQLKDPDTRDAILEELGEMNQRYTILLQRPPLPSREPLDNNSSPSQDDDAEKNRLRGTVQPPFRAPASGEALHPKQRPTIPPELRDDVKELLQQLQGSGMTPEEQKQTFTTELRLLLESETEITY